MTDEIYPGVYRGEVVDIADPEVRKRYRVRVYVIHPEEIPNDNIPWAELAFFGGKDFGDIPAFLEGDRVFVSFEGGNRRFPVILGGFMSEVGGVPDAPSEVRADYEKTQERWVRLDRVGNTITMSPLPNERWIHLKSGEAEIFLRSNDGAIEINSTSQLQVTAPVILAEATTEIVVNTPKLFAQVANEATIRCADVVNIQGSTVINIGRYEDPILGPLVAETTDLVEIQANNEIIAESGGNIDVDAQADITVDTQTNYLLEAQQEINLYGVNEATIRSDGNVNVTAGGKVIVDAQDNCEVTSAAAILVESTQQIEITAGTECTIVCNGGNMTIEAAAGNVEIKAAAQMTIEATGTLDITSQGPLSIESTSQLSLAAPLIEISADATLMMDGGGITTIGGGLITIG